MRELCSFKSNKYKTYILLKYEIFKKLLRLKMIDNRLRAFSFSCKMQWRQRQVKVTCGHWTDAFIVNFEQNSFKMVHPNRFAVFSENESGRNRKTVSIVVRSIDCWCFSLKQLLKLFFEQVIALSGRLVYQILDVLTSIENQVVAQFVRLFLITSFFYILILDRFQIIFDVVQQSFCIFS